MRAVRYHDHGAPDVLTVEEVPDPDPAPDEVLLAVAAAGVNPVDTYFREGTYEPAFLPMTPGVDAAGEVVAVGSDVERFEPGDHAVATGLSRDHHGSCAERVAVPEDRIATLPEDVDLVETGAAGVVSVTAFRAAIDHAGVEPAEWVLVHGGSGGVGHAAVQIAAAAGARVVATAAPEYHDHVADLGADRVLDYARGDLRDAVVAATDGGPNVVLDHRLDDYLQFDADVAAPGARVVGIGENDSSVGFEHVGAARSKDVQFTFVSMFNTPRLADPLARVIRLLADGDLSVSVARTYGLDEVGAAHRAVLSDSFLGKLAVVP